MSEFEVIPADRVPGDRLEAAYTGLAVLPRVLQEARAVLVERESILAAARQEATSIMEQARREADDLRAVAAQEAAIEIRHRFEAFLGDVTRRLEEEGEERTALLREAAFELAGAVVRMSHDRDPAAIEALVMTVAGEVERFTPIGVRIGPADAAFVGMEAGGVLGGLEVVVDESLDRGAILIRTRHGDVRSSFQDRIDALRGSLGS